MHSVEAREEARVERIVGFGVGGAAAEEPG
jgi:hypothetical protein